MFNIILDPFQDQQQADEYFMQHAYQLALKGKISCYPNPAVGCIIVKDMEVLGMGFHKYTGRNHAEINAIEDLMKRYPHNYNELLQQATVYVTMEPCAHYGRTPPCSKRLASYPVKRVVIGGCDFTDHANGKGIKILKDAGVKVDFRYLPEIALLNKDFDYLHNPDNDDKLPYLRLKIGASIDSRTSLPNGQSKWITNSASREYVQKLRKDTGAVFCTAKTVVIDNAKYTLRYEQLPREIQAITNSQDLKHPLVIVSDNSFILDENLELFNNNVNNHIIVISKDKHPLYQKFITKYGLNSQELKVDEQVIDTKEKITNSLNLPSKLNCKHISFISGLNTKSSEGLKEVFLFLKKQYNVKDLLLEAGATFAQSIVSANLFHELHYCVGNVILGRGNTAINTNQEFTSIDDCIQLELAYHYILGSNVYLVYIPNKIPSLTS